MKISFLLVPGWLATSLCGQPVSSDGVVAYVREGREIRLVAPDGTNDRLFWEHPRARQTPAIWGIHSLAWHPGGESLVFSSDHENAYSYYDHDVYTIGLNGAAPRRLTNTPDLSELAKFPKGQVSVTIENRQLRQYAGAPYSSTTSLFFVYVGGAEKPQMVTVPPGGRKTLVFDVAKFTDGPQPVVAIGGLKRWPGAPIRVQPGQNINVTLEISSSGLESFGAFDPAWSSDGARVAYRMGMCAGIWSVPGAPAPGTGIGRALAGTGKDRPACVFDWAPAGVNDPPILFAGWLTQRGGTDNSIYQTDEEGARVTRLVHFDSDLERIKGVLWMPDGSGFLFSKAESRGVETSTNLYRYDFRSRRIAAVTRLQGQHVRGFAVSPDGRWVVYERGKDYYFPSDTDRPALWLIRADGSQERRFVASGSSPAWGRTPGSRFTATPGTAPKPGTAATSAGASTAANPARLGTAPPAAGSEPSAAPDLAARSAEAVSAAQRGDYDTARRLAQEILRADPGRKEALFALAASAYATADFDLFERTAPAAVRNGAGMSFNLIHHHTLTGGHPAMLGIKQSTLVFDPTNAKDCNQRAFEQPLATIVSASQTATTGGEVFLALKMRDSQGKVRALNFADPGSTVDKSGGLPVLRAPANAARRLQALSKVIAAAANPSLAADSYREESSMRPSPAAAGSAREESGARPSPAAAGSAREESSARPSPAAAGSAREESGARPSPAAAGSAREESGARPSPAAAGSAVPEQQRPKSGTNVNTAQANTAGGSNTVAPGTRSRVPEGGSVLLCTDPTRLDGAMDFAKAGSAANAYQALRNEAFFRVAGPASLEARESDLKSRWPKVLVRVLDGVYAGRTGWVVLSELKALSR